MSRKNAAALLLLVASIVGITWWWWQRMGLSTAVSARGGQVVFEADTPEGPTTSVVFVGRPIGDEDLQILRNKSGFQRLFLDSTRVSGTGLTNLESAVDLRWLSMLNCPIGDDGLANLPALNSLALLDLDHTKITDAGLAHVGRLKGLKKLMICRNGSISDAGLEHLKGLEELTDLDALDTGITEEGIRRLQKSLPRLTKVQIGHRD
jgi:hypothetical protein